MDGDVGHEELESLVDGNSDDVRLVDIRRPAAYARGHVPGSENVPLGRLVDEVERFEGASRVVTLCPHGESSVQAARLIASYEGFDGRAESFGPGLAGWDGPVETGPDQRGDEPAEDEGPTSPF